MDNKLERRELVYSTILAVSAIISGCISSIMNEAPGLVIENESDTEQDIEVYIDEVDGDRIFNSEFTVEAGSSRSFDSVLPHPSNEDDPKKYVLTIKTSKGLGEEYEFNNSPGLGYLYVLVEDESVEVTKAQ